MSDKKVHFDCVVSENTLLWRCTGGGSEGEKFSHVSCDASMWTTMVESMSFVHGMIDHRDAHVSSGPLFYPRLPEVADFRLPKSLYSCADAICASHQSYPAEDLAWYPGDDNTEAGFYCSNFDHFPSDPDTDRVGHTLAEEFARRESRVRRR